ncbi:sigma-70 family RNA polymerase sigma factor [Vitiosangium sp. GDMCC 1.1324]|uniref:sigma-70 family RNA polymerase sigma factor n=1 Tax=Vitiosangium sp. (strain GDMCC 1.1324) TaxID=2138576 RepID=UPI000D39FBEB|nr:sigma-70 family RNA polymerase sigma factor [Vitiosangium sp. GDMCC 1.1324]PTL76977.1 transcriptional regulator [Vitiosangium sp. GDMCC 1.1324]
MPPPSSLASVFASHLRPSARAYAELPSLEAVLAELLASARAAWPRVRLDEAVFLRHLAERLPPSEEPERSLRAVPAADLFLACACLHGDAAAHAALESHFFPKVAAAVARVHPGADTAAEVCQVLREKLLTSEPGRPPRMAEYQGQGPLAAWLRAAAVRTALNLRRTASRQARAEEEALADATVPGSHPELEHLRQRHRADFQAALAEALSALPSRERTVLRLHLVEGLSLERIGTMYRTHKSTVSRWLARARDEVLAGTRARLAERLHLSEGELYSLLRDVPHQLDQSLSALLASSR